MEKDPEKIDQVLERGVSQILPSKKKLASLMKEKKITLYQGFDPSTSSLHLGNLIGIRKLAQFQKLGHKVIFLIGDFTGIIGDPTDKTAARKRLTRDEVLENAKDYQKQIENILNFEGENKAEVKFNSEWLSTLSFEEIVELSSHFTVQQMLERSMFEQRLKKERPIYLHEFLYPLMQGYDSVAMEVDLEIGGNDQLFNMMAGRNLMKSIEDKEKFVLTMKLLEDPSGKKMGKTKGNTVNLTDSPNDMFGKIMSLPDSFIKPGIELLTDLPVDTAEKKDAMEAKKTLSFNVVRQLYGEDEAKKAKEEFERTFQEGKTPTQIPEVSLSFDRAPIVDIMVETDLVDSKSQAKRLINQGAVKLDKKVIEDPTKEVEIDKKGSVLRVGKTRFVKIKRK